jgi:hypothetical protein
MLGDARADTSGDDATITDEQWSADVRKHFNGRIVVGKDLMEI